MGCSTCATKTSDGKSAGCKNNGSCDTGGCNKLNIYNWLSNMELPSGQAPFNIVEVRFKGSRKEFFRLEPDMQFKVDDMIAVEGNPGHDIGKVSIAGELVRLQLKKRGIKESSDEIKKVYRMARPIDIEKWEEAKAAEENTMYRARTIALQLKLSMKLSDVEYQGDMKKATFFYTADERVDFRELIKRLAEEFKVRIEMRQIGMRQEASRLGGIGSCGRELCCSTWLTDFKSVTTGAARYQNLALNPLKLAGQCGKLKCCLNYELDSYLDALRDLPDTNTYLKTEKGTAVHRKTDIFKRLMWYSYSNKLSTSEVATQFKESEDWVALPVDRVKEIISLNRKEVKPPDLLKHAEVPKEKAIGYEDVVGQDSITRMDNKPKNKKFKKRKNPNPVVQPGGSMAAPVNQSTANAGNARPAAPAEKQPSSPTVKPNMPAPRKNPDPPAPSMNTSPPIKPTNSNIPRRISPGSKVNENES
jgi:cell fate regulator YaaT (PSP1 superfamily)